jgi:hypothetical protein
VEFPRHRLRVLAGDVVQSVINVGDLGVFVIYHFFIVLEGLPCYVEDQLGW